MFWLFLIGIFFENRVETICISVPHSKFWAPEDSWPRDLCPCVAYEPRDTLGHG